MEKYCPQQGLPEREDIVFVAEALIKSSKSSQVTLSCNTWRMKNSWFSTSIRQYLWNDRRKRHYSCMDWTLMLYGLSTGVVTLITLRAILHGLFQLVKSLLNSSNLSGLDDLESWRFVKYNSKSNSKSRRKSYIKLFFIIFYSDSHVLYTVLLHLLFRSWHFVFHFLVISTSIPVYCIFKFTCLIQNLDRNTYYADNVNNTVGKHGLFPDIDAK